MIGMRRTGKPVCSTYVPSRNNPRQTAVAPCHTWKSPGWTGCPARSSHHCGVGNLVYTKSSRMVPFVGAGGARSGAMTSAPTTTPAPAAVPAITPALIQSRRVHVLGGADIFSTPQQYSYHRGSDMPPTGTVPSTRSGTTGRARCVGPCTCVAPTYRTPLLGWTLVVRRSGSYWDPWQMQKIGSCPYTEYVGDGTR